MLCFLTTLVTNLTEIIYLRSLERIIQRWLVLGVPGKIINCGEVALIRCGTLR